MSFILDALRKSEIERQRQSGPGIAEFPIAREVRRMPVALLVIGALLALNIAIVAILLLRGGSERDVSAEPVAAAAAVPAVARAPVTRAPPPESGPSALESEVLPPAEPPAVYYEPSATEAPAAPDPTLLPEAPGAEYGESGVTYDDAPAADDAAAVAAATGLPELSIDLHIFTDEPAKRAVFINGRRYAQGARIAEGPVVEEITRDGALLSYRGRRFLLPRL